MKLLIASICACLCLACSPLKQLGVTEISQPQFMGIKSVHMSACIDNQSGRQITITSAACDFSYKGKSLAVTTLMRPILIDPGLNPGVRIDLKIYSQSVLRLNSLRDKLQNNPDNLQVSVRAVVKVGKRYRKINLKNIPVSRFYTIFELT